jgi:hypothetical protein
MTQPPRLSDYSVGVSRTLCLEHPARCRPLRIRRAVAAHAEQTQFAEWPGNDLQVRMNCRLPRPHAVGVATASRNLGSTLAGPTFLPIRVTSTSITLSHNFSIVVA